MKGLIFSVRRYSVHDGPGIRVTFFMKGCPLSCIWCHNPEGISPLVEKVARINRVGEQSFTVEENAGSYYSIEDMLEILEKERIFLARSGGGVTFSGGEPMLQHDFLLAALQACKLKGYHTAVDTSGYAPVENFRAIMPFTDLFLYDLKHLDDRKHYDLTGVSNTLILENFRMLVSESKGVMVRIPVIPGLNDDKDNMLMTLSLLNSVSHDKIEKISLLPYHKIGSSKYRRFNREWKMEGIEPPSREEMRKLKELFSTTGIKVKTGG